MTDQPKFAMAMLLERADVVHDLRQFLELGAAMSKHYQVALTDLCYTLAFGNHWETTKHYRYKPRNLKHFLSFDARMVRRATLLSRKRKRDATDSSLSIRIHLPARHELPAQLDVLVDPTKTLAGASIGDLAVFVKQLQILKYRVVSGVGFLMAKEEYPTLFAAGIETSGLSEEEEDTDQAPTPNTEECRAKIWDIFPHNVVGKELLDRDLLSQIKDLVGNANVIEIGDNYIISLPLADRENPWHRQKTAYCKNHLRKLFRTRDLIWSPPTPTPSTSMAFP